MTGYHISLGYNSSGKADWNDVKDIANNIAKDEPKKAHKNHIEISINVA